jgi:tripartite-type tricarboxylate transporter receptor subunit TctC
MLSRTRPWSAWVLSIPTLCAIAFCGSSMAQSFPNRPVTIVVPYPPGGATDMMVRILQPRLQAGLGQSIVVENRGGANGSIGAASVAKAPPDGYRILMATQPVITINPHLQKDAGWNPQKDLVPLTNAVDAVIAVAVNASLPVNNLAELITYGRKNPGKLTFGTAGAGSPQHLGGVLLGQRAQVQWTHVPYKGGGPLINDLIAGHVPVGIGTLAIFKPFMNEGRLRVIAVGGASRFAGTPNIPTIAETLPGLELNTWMGFYAPAGTPPQVQKLLSTELQRALRAEDVRSRLLEAALVVNAEGPDALGRTGRSEFELYGRVVRDNLITLD